MFSSSKSRFVAGAAAALMALTVTAIAFPTAAHAAPTMTIHGVTPTQSSITLGGFPAVLFAGDCNTTMSNPPPPVTGTLPGCAANVSTFFSVAIDGDVSLDWTPNPDTLTVSNAKILIINNSDNRSCVLNLDDPIELSGPNTGPTYSTAAFTITAGAIGDYSITEDFECTGGLNGGLNNAIYQALNPDAGNADVLGTTYTATSTIDATFYVSY